MPRNSVNFTVGLKNCVSGGLASSCIAARSRRRRFHVPSYKLPSPRRPVVSRRLARAFAPTLATMSIPAPDRAIFAETPIPSTRYKRLYGSDVIAQMLRALDVPYLALNPGASFRGLHDSLVNHLSNERPQMLLCLHEESAVAIAHGYAKVSQRMLGVVLHSNVGLMHATMAIFNAWCDRVPMLLLGATGPVDAAKRRPWIDWLHTAADQGALIRDYTKWDNQPASIPAAYEALLRAVQLARTPPCGPTYVNLDAALQETPLDAL